MIRIPGIPFLPGTALRDVARNRYPRISSFTYQAGVNALVEKDKDQCRGRIVKKVNGLYPPEAEPQLPGWITYDKKILRFDGYFKETLQEVARAPYQVRKVKIYYYLEDDTVQVVEPKIINSGIPQGCLVSRQRIPRAAPCEDEFLNILDFNVNKTVRIYDRIYHVTNCDRFTRHFLNRAGVGVPDPVEQPPDPSTELRRDPTSRLAKHPSNNIDTFGQFLKYDRQVLKFHGYWDDRTPYGEVRKLEIQYYLADDTLEIKEILPVNSGRSPGMCLKRTLLPKEWSGQLLPGGNAVPTVLNVLGGGLSDGRYMLDPLDCSNKKYNCYTDKDLLIGTHLDVFGRDVVLTDCDKFTKEYYRKRYGIESFTPLQCPVLTIPTRYELSDRILPPFNGWGTHEDSESNCITVEPKPPHFDLGKFLKLDKIILRFGATMVGDTCDRVFIISYYMVDDTISIFEHSVRNSGFGGGEFAKRDKFILPDQNILTPFRPKRYLAKHFYLGATVTLRDYTFRLIKADEFALQFMERNPHEFPKADINRIMPKIREALRPIYKDFVAENFCYLKMSTVGEKEVQIICYDNLREALKALLCDRITEHEILTVCRHFAAEKVPVSSCPRDQVRATAHLLIQRDIWDSFDRLKEYIGHLDPESKGYLCETTIRCIIKSCRLPFTKEMVDCIIFYLKKNEMGEIETEDFINFINVNHNAPPAVVPLNTSMDLCQKIEWSLIGGVVNWDAFIECVGLEVELLNQSK